LIKSIHTFSVSKGKGTKILCQLLSELTTSWSFSSNYDKIAKLVSDVHMPAAGLCVGFTEIFPDA